MSNKLTRKGLAFGAIVALGSTLFAGAPAYANSSGPLTLLPDGGTRDGATYTSLIGAGITLSSELDANKQFPDDTATDSNGDVYIVTAGEDPIADAWYVITNPGAAEIRIEVDSEDAGYYIYDGDGIAGGVAGADDGDFDSGSVGTFDYGTLADDLGTDMQEDLYVDINDGTPNVYYTNATKIAVRAADATNDTPGERTVANMFIDAEDADQDTKVTMTVTVLTDTISGNSTRTGLYNNGEYKSATQTVTLLDPASVVYTTVLDAESTTRADDTMRATVTIGSSVNPYSIASSDALAVIFYRNGVSMDMEDEDGLTDIATDDSSEYIEVNSTNADSIEENGLVFGDEWEDAASLDSAVYSARAIWTATDPDQYAGSRSVVLDLRNGTNADVADIYALVADSANVSWDGEDSVAVRTGTSTVGLALQIDDTDGDDLSAAGVRVRVTVTADELDADSEVTVGATKLSDEEDFTYYGFTNSSGQVIVSMSNSGAEAGDTVSVSYAVLQSNGIYDEGQTQTFTWADAALQPEFEVSPSGILAGNTINVTFTAVDQWGVGIDSTDDGRISFKVEAVVDGVIDEAEYSETEPTKDGAASFSFTNFATAGSNQEIIVYMYQGTVSDAGTYYTVYKNLATSSIQMADQFDTDVEYVDWVTGDASKPSVAAAAADLLGHLSEDEGDEYALISGTVLDANNAGQPGVAVTISSAGVLFYDDSDTFILAKDSITVYANAQGYFDVKAMVQTVNTTGRTVTVTADGKSTTTLLKSYLETGIQAEDTKLSWSLPASIVKNTTYSVDVLWTDIYGNPIRTFKSEDDAGDEYSVNALTFAAEGSLQVNGVASVERNFGLTGKATIYVRSVADIAGPGTLTALLDDSINYYTGRPAAAYGSMEDVSDSYVDDADTSWDESDWSNLLTTTVDVLDVAPAGASGVKVNVGSFNGKLVVYAVGAAGAKISWKVAGKWGVGYTVGTTLNRFDRPVGAAGVNAIVEIYVNGVKQLTKTVLTR